MVILSKHWVRLLAFQLWLTLLVGCRSDLAIFVPSTTAPSIDKVSSVYLDDQGQMHVEWTAKANAPKSVYQIYLLELPPEESRFAFTSASILSEPLEVEEMAVESADAPRQKGTLVGAVSELKFSFPETVKPESRYLLQIFERGRKKVASIESATLLQVKFKGFAATSAIAIGDEYELSWSAVPGANRYEVFEDEGLTKILGSTTETTIRVSSSSAVAPRVFYVKAYRGSLASPEIVEIKLNGSAVKATRVSAITPNGKYTAGQTLEFAVDFTEKVSVFGSSTLPLEMKSVSREATYLSGSGSTRLLYGYEIRAGDDTDDLQNGSLLSGSFVDAAGLSVAGNLPEAGSNFSLAETQTLIVDTIAPTPPSSVGFSTAVSNNGNFDVSWAASTDQYFKTHKVKLCSDSACSSGCSAVTTSSETSKAFASVPEGNYHACVQGEDTSDLTSAWVASIGTLSVDFTSPTATRVYSQTADGLYKEGDSIAIALEFSEAVFVTTPGQISLKLETGTTDRSAAYASGSGTNILVFTYVPQLGDEASDLNYHVTSPLTIGTGAIRDVASNNASPALPAIAGPNSLASQSDIVIDTTAPALATAVGFGTGTVANTSFAMTWTDSSDVNFRYHNVKLCTANDCATGCSSASTALLSPATMSGTNGGTYYGCVQGEDLLGHVSSWVVSASPVSIDTSLAGVTQVVSSTADGLHGVGTVMNFLVSFSRIVNVTNGASIRLELETGTTNFAAPYVSGSGTDTLTFAYTVQAGDTSADLNYVSTSALTLNGGTIKDTGGNDADLALPDLNDPDSLGQRQDLVIDTTNPTAPSAVTVAAYSATLNFAANWTASADTHFSRHNVKICSSNDCATSCSGDSTTAGTSASFTGANGQSYYACVQGEDLLGLTSAWIPSASSLAVDTSAATVSSVRVTNADAVYKLGDQLTIHALFSEAIAVSNTADLSLLLETGTSDRSATYTGITGGNTIVFTYTVQAGDTSADLDFESTTALSRGATGTIKDLAGNDAVLTLPALGGPASIAGQGTAKIDTTAPVAPSNVGFASPLSNTLSFDMSWTDSTDANFATHNAKICTSSDCSTGCRPALTSIASPLSMTGVNGATYYGCVQGQDAVGLVSAWINSAGTVLVDTTQPTVTNVSSSLANGPYGPTENIDITVQFSETVVVTTPAQLGLLLETGGTDRTALYLSGTNSNTLVFRYTVQAGDIASDLEAESTAALTVGAGFIKDLAGSDAVLTLPALGGPASLSGQKDLIIDTAAPAAPSIVSPANGFYSTSAVTVISGTSEANATIELKNGVTVIGSGAAVGTAWSITLSSPLSDGTYSLTATAEDAAGNISSASTANSLIVDTSAPNAPVITTVTTPTNDRSPSVTGTSEANMNIILYADAVQVATVAADSSGDWTISTSDLADGSHTLTATATDPGPRTSAASAGVVILVDTVQPTVVSLTSTTADGTYGIGSSINTTINFSEPVNYVASLGHYVRIQGNAGGSNPYAYWSGGSGTSVLTSSFNVGSGVTTADMDYVATNSLAGTYTDAAGNNAILTLPAPGDPNSIGANKAIVLDGIAPTISNITSTTSNGAYGPGNIIDVLVTFTETVTVTGTPYLTVNTAPARNVNYASGSGTNTLTFNYTVQTGDIQADLNVSAIALNGGTIQDAALNDASLTVPGSGLAGSLDLNKNIAIAGNSVAPSLSASPSSQNAFTLSAISSVNTSASGGTDNDADGEAVTYTCRFDTTNNSAMDAGGTLCSSLPNNAYSFNTSTGVLTWTPSAGAVANNSTITTYEFQISGQDTTHLTGTTYFTVSLLNPFTTGIPFDAGTSASYTFDQGQIDFSGGFARLQPIDTTDDDNAATGFLGGTHKGVKWYINSPYYERLDTDATSTCNGRTTNCAGGVQNIWAPQIASRNTVHGWESGTAPWAAGIFGTAPTRSATYKRVGGFGLSFNGTTDHFYKTSEVVDDFTVSFMFSTTQSLSNSFSGGTACIDFADGAGILSTKRPGTANDWAVNLCDGYILAGVGNPNTTIKSTNRYNDGAWHHVAFTRNKTSGVIKLYIDGVLLGTATGNTSSLNSNGNWNLGAMDDGQPRYAGSFDELSSWTTVLTDAQIENLWLRQSSRYSGDNISRVMDSTSASTVWTGLSWTTTKPFGKELPDYNAGIQSETTGNYLSVPGGFMANIAGLWHFNETALGTAPGALDFADDSGQGNHGASIYNGGATHVGLGSLGRFGKSASFSGQNAVNLGSSANFDFGTSAFTISTWIKTNSKAGGRIFSSKGSWASPGVDLSIEADGKILFSIGCTNQVQADCPVIKTVASNFTDGSWHNVVIMNDKTYDVMKIFVDGRVQQVELFAGWSGNCPTIQNAGTELKYTTCTQINGNRTSGGVYIGAFQDWLSNFSGQIDEVAIWKSRKTNGEIEELYRRGANRLFFQVKSCALSDCSDATFKGPDGTNQTYFSEYNNNSVQADGTGLVQTSSPALLFSNFPSLGLSANRYFQYYYLMETDESGTICSYSGGGPCSPELRSVQIGPTGGYPTNSPSIVYNTAIPFYTLGGGGGFTETSTCAGTAKYQLSVNNSTWYYWDGAAWSTSNGSLAQSSSMATLSSNAATFATAVGRTSLYVKALLPSDGSTQCTLDALGITGNNAY